MFRAKICGITNMKDAILSESLGAWALGFVFAESPRKVGFSDAGNISASIGRGVLKFGVFVNPSMMELEKAVVVAGVDVLQLHGDESPEFCEQVSSEFGLPVVKAIRVKDEDSIQGLSKYDVFAFLLDSFSDKGFGGTGETFDRTIASKAKIHGKIIISGGITASNVIDVVQQVRPYAIDLSSGVEEYPGKKNHKRLKELFKTLNTI